MFKDRKTKEFLDTVKPGWRVTAYKEFAQRHPILTAKIVHKFMDGNTVEEWIELNSQAPGYAAGALFAAIKDKSKRRKK